MKTTITDKHALRALRPTDLAAYLRASGWIFGEGIKGKSSVWTNKLSEDLFEINLPSDSGFLDFSIRMGEILDVLALFENRPQLQIFNDLLMATSDVTRIRIADSKSNDGTISIESNATAANKAKELILSSACATVEKRSIWHNRKPQEAIDHLKKVRIGQSERGSYVITVITHIPIQLFSEDVFDNNPPFERLVTINLAQALVSVRKASETAALTQNLSVFEQSVRDGVSANLCDAIVGLYGDSENDRNLDFQFTWSAGRKYDEDLPRKVNFPPESISVISEASRMLREKAPIQDYDFSGFVVKLDKPVGATIGKATIAANVEGEQRMIVLELPSDEYQKAIKAHREVLLFRGFGTLKKEGRSLFLKNPRDLKVIENAD